ncbi:MAG TPA: nucleotidyltransferase family protein [Trueperaceae bacterium]
MQESGKVVAVVLAGGDPNDALAKAAKVPSKSLVPLNGRPMAAFVLSALRASRSVCDMVVVGPPCDAPDFDGVRLIPPGSGFGHSLALGLGAAQSLAAGSTMLVVTADVPWLTGDAIDRFVARAGDADLAYPIVSAEDSLAAFPTHERTFVKVKQGRFTGGNLMLLRPTLTAPLLRFMDRVYLARKNPFALARLVGPRTLLALLAGRADVNRLEQIVTGRLGGKVRAVISEDASLAADVDRLEHLGVPMNPVVRP